MAIRCEENKRLGLLLVQLGRQWNIPAMACPGAEWAPAVACPGAEWAPAVACPGAEWACVVSGRPRLG